MRARFILALTFLVSGIGCGDDQDPEGAAALLTQVQAADYRSWARAPGYETREPSRAAHGDSVDVFINDVVVDALANGVSGNAWPEGSIIVKDGYDGGDLFLIAIMEKRADGEWFWAEYNDGGDSLFSGTPQICLGCHRIGDDWVRSFYFPE